jgi:tetratricopeptide (TPR) repeat protein
MSSRRLLLGGAAALLAGLVYLNALHNPFVYDDYRTIVENVSVQSPGSFRAIVLHDITRPIVNISYAADRALWGAQPFGFHVTSVLLHMLNVMLLCQLAWQFADDVSAGSGDARHAGAGKRADARSARSAMPARGQVVACTAAVLFAVHPMMTEAVGYISGRSEVLCATFFLLALMCGRRWLRGDGTIWALLSIGLWIVAMATKEIAAMFPFVLASYDWLIAPATRVEKRRRMLTVHLPMVTIALLAAVIRLAVFARVENAEHVMVQWPYVLLELDVVRQYLTLMLFPVGQAMFHDVSLLKGIFDPRAVLAVGTLGLMVALAWRLRRVDGLASFGVLWFLLLLLPSSALVALGHGEAMTEHRVYLASCGLFLAVGAAIGRLLTWLARVNGPAPLLSRAVLATGVIVLCALTVSRNVVWASPVTLWHEAVDRAPDHWRPRLLLGEALQDNGRRDEAVDQYKAALRIRPTEPSAYMKLGLCFAEMGRLQEAAATFQRLRDLDPRSAGASTGLGAVAMLQGQHDRARQYFLEAIDRDPRNVSARRSLAILDEIEPANPEEALRLCQEIQQLAPQTPGNDECIRRNQARVNAIRAGRR